MKSAWLEGTSGQLLDQVQSAAGHSRPPAQWPSLNSQLHCSVQLYDPLADWSQATFSSLLSIQWLSCPPQILRGSRVLRLCFLIFILIFDGFPVFYLESRLCHVLPISVPNAVFQSRWIKKCWWETVRNFSFYLRTYSNFSKAVPTPLRAKSPRGCCVHSCVGRDDVGDSSLIQNF